MSALFSPNTKIRNTYLEYINSWQAYKALQPQTFHICYNLSEREAHFTLKMKKMRQDKVVDKW